MGEAVLLVHAGATWFMTGLIWFVQLVHYPLFARVAPQAAAGKRDSFCVYATEHRRRTTWIVAPVMGIEAVTAAALLLRPAPGLMPLLVVNAVLLALIWLATAFVQVPCHRRLSAGFDPAVARRLVASNWWRTAAWSARAILVSWLVLNA